LSEQEPEEKRIAYAADITYGTNNEFGFDYLRDNMAFSTADKVQRRLHYAIIDEVDSILIDEARTPLIISGATDDNTSLYEQINRHIPELKRQQENEYGEVTEAGDYTVDEKAKQVYFTEDGHQHIETLLSEAGLLGEGESLYNASNIRLMHHLNAALRAHVLFERDVDYIVQNKDVVIVDEFTGRTMPGRRWSDGLHQAVEAKEGVPIRRENQTMASITFQNYFRIYNKLSGMTGTADTEAFEFQQIYNLEVIVVPTDKNMQRIDNGDLVYRTMQEKFDAIVEDIRGCRERGQPVLVGTASIEVSELLSKELKKNKIKHEVLNAKNHRREATIIEQAGASGSITIATNMAGRGTDIVLGGSLEADLTALNSDDEAKIQAAHDAWQVRHDDVLSKGGLHIIGTERHESRRIDNQLRGRSGRQGDPGSTRFYLSLEDSLMRIFASDKVAALMQKLGMEEGEAIEHPWVSKAIENAQRKVEGHNFDIRKQLLEFDDVSNDQRKVVYEQRNEMMESDDVSEIINTLRVDVLDTQIDLFIPPQSLDDQWEVTGLEEMLNNDFGLSVPVSEWLKEDETLHEESLRARILESLEAAYATKEAETGSEVIRHFEKAVMLQVLDSQWKDHLSAMDHLRMGIHLRGYAQKNPKQEYKREAFEMFTDMLERIKIEAINILSRVQVREEEDVRAIDQQRRVSYNMDYQHDGVDSLNQDAAPDAGEEEQAPYKREARKIGRNEPCPCGSGKKFKQCHGRLS